MGRCDVENNRTDEGIRVLILKKVVQIICQIQPV